MSLCLLLTGFALLECFLDGLDDFSLVVVWVGYLVCFAYSVVGILFAVYLWFAYSCVCYL